MGRDVIDVHLPDLGEIDEVRVIEWLKRGGEVVCEGEDLVEVETEKTTFVIPAPATGRLIDIVAPETTTVSTGKVLGEIELE